MVPSVVQLGEEEAFLLPLKVSVAASPAGAAAKVLPATEALAGASGTLDELEQGGGKSLEINRQVSVPAN
jgi:hypothetical protein